MRKRRKIALAALTALAAACLAAGCAAAKGYEFDYEQYVPETEQDYTLDDGVVIDGIADETFWEGLTPLSFTDPESGITMTTRAYIGENGLYLYAQSTDRSVFFSTEKEFYQNDEMEFMIDPRPAYSRSEEGMSLEEPVRTDCLQVRVDSQGRNQKYYGRKVGKDYPWATGWYSVEAAAVVNGTLNEVNGAQGYAVELFVAWEAMMLSEKPKEVAVCPAFNNTDTASDTGRKWFTYKGMSHSTPSSYAVVDETGFQIIANDFELSEPLDLNADDYADATVAQIIEVTQENTGDAVRGEMRARLGEDGIYFYAVVHDKALTHYSSTIWNNDGLELYLDLDGVGGNNRFREGILRVGVDIDEGYAMFTQRTTAQGAQQSLCTHRKMFVVTNIAEYTGAETAFDYRYTYKYEFMIPYASLGFSEAPDHLSFGWAINTPNELSYTKDRMLNGTMTASDWLYANGHHPHTPSQYYRVYQNRSEVTFEVDDMQGVVGYYTAIFPKFLNGIQEERVTYSISAADSAKVEIVGNKLYPKEEGQYTVTAMADSGATATFTLSVIGMDDPVVATRDEFTLNEFWDRVRLVVARQESFGFDEEGLTLFIGDSFMDDGLFFTDFYTRYSGNNANISGISASLAAQWIYYAQDILYPYAPDQVVVHLGTNDIGGQTASEVASTLTYMFDSFHDALPDTTFWWWTIEQHVGWAGNYKAVAVNAAMREYAQDKDWLKIVDSYTAVSNADGTPNESLYRDSVHLTLEGYQKVLDAMSEMGFGMESRTVPLVSFDGEGTQESPFLIGTTDDLLRFSAAVTSKLSYMNASGTYKYAAAYYRLTMDIPLAGIDFPSIGRCTARAHAADTDVAFTGTFDGNGKTISDLTLSSSDGSLGLFGHTNGATIFDLIIDNAQITANGMRAAILIGRAQSTTVTNVTVHGMVKGTESVGGIVGIIAGGACTITNCTNYADLTGDAYGTGGIVGDNNGAGYTITGCANYGEISGQYAGGIIGYTRSVSGPTVIDNCYNYGDLSGTQEVGGIAGRNVGSIAGSFCLSTALLTQDEEKFFASDLYAFGTDQSVGAIAGVNDGSVSGCGTVDAEGIQTPIVSVTVKAIGAVVKIISIVEGQVTFSVTPLEGYTFAGAFLGEALLDGQTFPMPQENVVLTVICNMSFGGGSGTPEDPFVISEAQHLRMLSAAVNSGEVFLHGEMQTAYALAHYVLGADIDLNGEQFAPVGDTQAHAFGGTFDGNEYTIYNLSITSAGGTIGLFGNTNGAAIFDLTIDNAQITANGMRAAVLIGRAQSTTVTNVTVHGTVKGAESVGGIVGIIAGGACTITNCTNYADLTGDAYGAGGIVGDNNGAGYTITGCANYGEISGQYAGGIIGYTRSVSGPTIIENCYNYGNLSGEQEAGGIAGGNVGTIENCYTLSTVTIALAGVPQAANTLPETGSAASAYAGYLAGRNTGTITGGGLCDAQGEPVAIVITLSLDADGGTLPEGTAATIYVAHGAAAGSLPSPTRTGFRFDGWYEGDTLVTAQSVYCAPARTVTLTAHWVEQVNITFEAGSGSFMQGGSTFVLTIDKGSSISELPTATRAEYALVGWYDGEILVTTATTFDSDTTLTAQWESSPTYTLVTFDVNGGTYTDEQQTQIELPVGDILGTLPEATYVGYRLVGWFTADGTQVNANSMFSVSAVTLTARWQKVTEVTFVAPYGGSLAESTRLVDEGQPLGALPKLVLLAGNELIGWYDEEGQAVTSDSTFTADAVTLTARDGWDGTTASASLAGTGTESDPYQIASGADLRYMSEQTLGGNNFNGAFFILLTDIDLNNKQFAPIGDTQAHAFGGTFDGNEYTIYNLSITSAGGTIGLFGNTNGATIFDLTIDNAQITANGMRAAVLIGRAQTTAVTNVTVYGMVTGVESVGGIAGIVAGGGTCTFIDCTSYAVLTNSGSSTGGIVGDTNGAEIVLDKCENYGEITVSNSGAGGIIGLIRAEGMLTNCTNSGAVTVTVAFGSTAQAGGIVGGVGESGVVSVSGCENSGAVNAEGAWYVGGIIGYGANTASSYASITIDTCINRGEISSAERVGGIVGGSASASVTIGVTNSTNYGRVIATNNVTFVGGIFGLFRTGGNQTVDAASTTKLTDGETASEGLIFRNGTQDVTADALQYLGSV